LPVSCRGIASTNSIERGAEVLATMRDKRGRERVVFGFSSAIVATPELVVAGRLDGFSKSTMRIAGAD
jgi:hypothetical protein